MLRSTLLSIIFFLCLAFINQPGVEAWSKEGHMMTCRIAQVFEFIDIHQVFEKCFLFLQIIRTIACGNRTCWMMRQLMQSRCCCQNMLTATCQPSVCGRTKSGTGISIGGQVLYTSLIPQIKLAPLIMKVSQMHQKEEMSFSLFSQFNPIILWLLTCSKNS